MRYSHILGIDLSKATIDLALSENKADASMLNKKLTNNIKGFNDLIAWLSHLQIRLDQVLICLESIPAYSRPKTINTDKNPAYGKAISELKLAGKYPSDLEHRQVKYLNNRIESDHGKLKRLINPTLGFKSMKTAFATIKGFEADAYV